MCFREKALFNALSDLASSGVVKATVGVVAVVTKKVGFVIVFDIVPFF